MNFKAGLFGLSAFFCMAVFGILTKIALVDASSIWISFFAYLTGTLALSLFMGKQTLKSEHYSFLIGRAVFGTMASFLYTISINYVPIVNATLLFNTAPIFIPVLALFWFKKMPPKVVWFAVVVGFLGIMIIIQPTAAIFTQSANLIALGSGLSLAIAYFLMKLLTGTDPGERIIFYYLGIGTLMQLPLLFFAGPLPALEPILYAMISGLMLLIAQLALVKAYTYASASQVGVYQYSSVVFVALIQWILWGAVPSAWDLLGVLLVALAGTAIIRSRVEA